MQSIDDEMFSGTPEDILKIAEDAKYTTMSKMNLFSSSTHNVKHAKYAENVFLAYFPEKCNYRK